ncbi:DUF998 domain-containing protein [Haploplasma axanthum]|nr:DUF998 domain-containing protein [Haploplasma axanthum]
MKRKLKVLALLGLVLYFMHVILGNILNHGYNPLKQAVSDLTADGASNVILIRLITFLSGLLFSVCLIVLSLKIRKKGIIGFACMQCVSTIGYLIFPLSNKGDYKDIGHLVVTGIVVLLSIVSIILVYLDERKINKKFSIFSLVVLLVMFLGAMFSNILSDSYFGVAERFTVYSVIIYMYILVVYYSKKIKNG